MDSNQFRDEIVDPTLLVLGLYSPGAAELLMLTAAQESKLGYYIVQIKGPAKGVFQMEPATHDDIWENFLKYKPELAEKLKHLAGTHPTIPDAGVMVYNLRYAAAMTRVHYLRAPGKLPAADDVNGMAGYWKRYYNTPLGRGTTTEAVHNYARYVEV